MGSSYYISYKEHFFHAGVGAASLLNYPTIALPILIKIKCEKEYIYVEGSKNGGGCMGIFGSVRCLTTGSSINTHSKTFCEKKPVCML